MFYTDHLVSIASMTLKTWLNHRRNSIQHTANACLERKRARTRRPFCKAGLALAGMFCLALADGTSASAQSLTLTPLHSFTGGADGGNPYAGLIQGSDGNFYGTASMGGNVDTGTVFKITPGGALTILHIFAGTPDGQSPDWLIQGRDGNFYGTTAGGGTNSAGTVFSMTPAGAVNILYSFTSYTSGPPNADGFHPNGIVQGPDGNFYGTALGGGLPNNGTVFQLTPAGVFTNLHTFSATTWNGSAAVNSDGATPQAPLTLGSDGAFYGTTAAGGPNGYGTLFKITPDGTFTTLASFPYYSQAWGAMVQASDGNFYGTTFDGGQYGLGAIYALTPGGTLTYLHSFYSDGTSGYGPRGLLIQASDGNLYGTTFIGGQNHTGTLFRCSLGGTFTTLYSFSLTNGTGTNTDGDGPLGGVIQGSDGSFYGTCCYGGAYYSPSYYGYGTVFRFGGVPTPVIAGLSPASTNAGGSAFTLIVKGSAFASTSTVNWNGSPLTSTFVSSSELKASVPASLIANPGATQVTVVTPGGGTSAAKNFTILVTTLKMVSASLSKDSSTGAYTANVSLKNLGYLAAPNVKITKASLALASTSSVLPVSMGSIAAGSSGSASLIFPGSAGTSGTVVYLKASGTFSGGKFAGSLKVTLP